MAATKTQLTGGAFQDGLGNVLAKGYLKMKLSQDASVSGVGNICSGLEITIQLDVNGNVVASPAQSVWANTGGVLAPINTFYKVTGYTAAGQRAWGPNNQQVAAGATFNLGSWVPNQVIQWFPTVGAPPLMLEVNDTPNLVQTTLNLEAGTGVTLTDEGDGGVTIAATATAVNFETNGTPNGSQSKLNLVAGSNVTITDDGSGDVTIASSGAAPAGASVADIPPPTAGAGNFAGYSLILRISAGKVLSIGSRIKIGLAFYNIPTGTAVINAAVIGATIANPGPAVGGFSYNYAWTTSPVAITWPVGAFANNSQLYFSNPTTIPIDTQHDYYIIIYLDSTCTADVPYSPATVPGWVNMGGYLHRNATGDSDASGLTGPSLFDAGAILGIQSAIIA